MHVNGRLHAALRAATMVLPLGDAALCGPPITEVPLYRKRTRRRWRPCFRRLSDPVRLRLLSIVAAQGEVCSCHLQEPLGKSQPTISHHTRVLAEAGLIEGDKRGKWTWWRGGPRAPRLGSRGARRNLAPDRRPACPVVVAGRRDSAAGCRRARGISGLAAVAAAALRSGVLGVEGLAVSKDCVYLPGLAIGGALDPELILLGVAAGRVALVHREARPGFGQPELARRRRRRCRPPRHRGG